MNHKIGTDDAPARDSDNLGCGTEHAGAAAAAPPPPPRAAAAAAAAAAPSGSNTVPIDYSKWDKLTLSDDSD